jgi:hypothetical protein
VIVAEQASEVVSPEVVVPKQTKLLGARVNDMLGRLNRALGNLGNNLTEQTEDKDNG